MKKVIQRKSYWNNCKVILMIKWRNLIFRTSSRECCHSKANWRSRSFDNPKALKKLEKQLQRQHKLVIRRKKGSRNRKKAVKTLQRLYSRIANVRKDAIHKTTTAITKRYGIIGIETLNVNGMLKNHTLAKSIADASFSEFYRQLKYKAAWHGGQVIEADRFYPSSKTCSRCGTLKDTLSLSNRTFVCTLFVVFALFHVDIPFTSSSCKPPSKFLHHNFYLFDRNRTAGFLESKFQRVRPFLSQEVPQQLIVGGVTAAGVNVMFIVQNFFLEHSSGRED